MASSSSTAGPSTVHKIDTNAAPIEVDQPKPSWSAYGEALKTIKPVEDLKNVGNIPCGRDSLLYGIGGGVGIGCLRFLGSSNPRIAGNWAVGSFMVIALYQWETCRRTRKRQEDKLKILEQKYPHRHINTLKQRAEEEGKEMH